MLRGRVGRGGPSVPLDPSRRIGSRRLPESPPPQGVFNGGVTVVPSLFSRKRTEGTGRTEPGATRLLNGPSHVRPRGLSFSC